MSLKLRVRRTVLRLLAGFTSKPSSRSGSVIIPPAGPGSMGDEAMIEGLAYELGRNNAGPVTLYRRRGAIEWKSMRFIDENLDQPASGLDAARALAKTFARSERVFVIGADCIDGYYSSSNSSLIIDLCDMASRSGCRATVTGSSFRETPSNASVQAIQALHDSARLCARDPVSAERIERITGRKPILVADAAFMLPPAMDHDVVRDHQSWCDNIRSNGGFVLGVNFNHQVMPKGDRQAIDALLESYTSTLRSLLENHPDLTVLLVPHDYRSDMNDLSNLEQIESSLRDSFGPERLRLVTDHQSPGVLKGIASVCDIVLTGRMHLAIGALGSGVPVGCVTYQGKFEGLFKHFELDPVTIAPDRAVHHAELLALAEWLIADRIKLREHIAGVLPDVKARSLQNLGLS